MRLHLRSNRPIVAALLWTALAAPPAAAQPGAPPPEVAAAQAALRAGQPDSAITTLLAYFTKNPQATAGRLVLGNAYRQRGDLDKALSTFLGITQPRPMQLQAMFNAAAIHAVRGNAAGAITLLMRLKESGAFDMNLAKSSKDFAALSTNPRFAAAMFQPADFIKPFVEPAIILREFTGETAGDQFSWIARSVGDVNGDGVSDLVTSAPTYGATSPTASRGRVYVYSGLTGALLWKVTGAEGESLGLGLEGAGDVNRDGVGDVIAGAPGGQSGLRVFRARWQRAAHTRRHHGD
jgi:tetratricopeptide (TPR) repeat protein